MSDRVRVVTPFEAREPSPKRLMTVGLEGRTFPTDLTHWSQFTEKYIKVLFDDGFKTDVPKANLVFAATGDPLLPPPPKEPEDLTPLAPSPNATVTESPSPVTEEKPKRRGRLPRPKPSPPTPPAKRTTTKRVGNGDAKQRKTATERKKRASPKKRETK